jgi:hypothetical protein
MHRVASLLQGVSSFLFEHPELKMKKPRISKIRNGKFFFIGQIIEFSIAKIR